MYLNKPQFESVIRRVCVRESLLTKLEPMRALLVNNSLVRVVDNSLAREIVEVIEAGANRFEPLTLADRVAQNWRYNNPFEVCIGPYPDNNRARPALRCNHEDE